MKETILSNCEKEFLLSALCERRRLDGRKFDEFRNLKIHFGSDWGCCQVSLGETKVLAQVSCEVQQPKPTRPNEGLLLVFVESSPMGAPHFEIGRQSDLTVQLNRLLEKCLKDSRCVDLESLCIIAEEKVWAVRVDVNVLNHEGNLIDAASVAALTALAHFRRPDVTITGEQTIIHDPSERDPIPLSLHHHPVCITYAIFDKGDQVIADPTAIEERVSEAQIVFGINAYREVCGLHLGGSALATPQVVLKYANCAAQRALHVVQTIKRTLELDNEARMSGKDVGFMECIRNGEISSLTRDCFSVQLDSRGFREAAKALVSSRKNKIKALNMGDQVDSTMEVDPEEDEMVVVPCGKGSAELVNEEQQRMIPMKNSDLSAEIAGHSGSSSSIGVEELDNDENSSVQSMSDSSEVELLAEISKDDGKKVVDSIDLSGDSEEEETGVLHADELNLGPKRSSKIDAKEESSSSSHSSLQDEPYPNSRGWYNSQW